METLKVKVTPLREPVPDERCETNSVIAELGSIRRRTGTLQEEAKGRVEGYSKNIAEHGYHE